MDISSMFVADERFAVFIDGSNISKSVRFIDMFLDDEKLLNFLRYESGDNILVRAYRYETVPPDTHDEEHRRRIINWHGRLEHLGYTLITKEQREHSDGHRSKGNIDGMMITDMMDFSRYVDHLVLLSGDGGFCYTVARLQQQGKRVSVIAVDETSSNDLKRQADAFIALESLRGLVAKDEAMA